jgi:DNA-binding winged helix-turn-helix (wHTH) protein
MTPEPDECLPPLHVTLFAVATNMAGEGIPIAAIARCIEQPSGLVLGSLKVAVDAGTLTALPTFDWPPTSKSSDHVPRRARTQSDRDISFAARKMFKLTPLEAAFLLVLLRNAHADKARLHTVVENQRFTRASHPDQMESTDPKMVDVMICKLRKRLKVADPVYVVKTVWGSGYYIEPAVQSAILLKLAETNDVSNDQPTA